MPILKKEFQTRRQILRSFGQNLKELNETMGFGGGAEPAESERKRMIFKKLPIEK